MAIPDRWPPWIEPRVTSTANVAITAAGQVAITGTLLSITPHIATRVQVVAHVRLTCTLFTAITGAVRVKLLVNGVALGPEAAWQAPGLNQNTLPGAWTVDIPAQTTTTFELALDLGGTADNDYLSIGSHTGYVLAGMPNLHS